MDSYILMNGLCNQSVDCVSKKIRNLEECAWKKELGASLELIKKRLNIFPNGLWRLYHNAKLVSYMYYIRIDERKKYYSWFDYCDNGTCENFKNDGKLLFGVSIGSIEKHMGNYLFSMGMDKIIEGYYKNVEKVCMCSRIPSLSRSFKRIEDVPCLELNDEILMRDHVVKMFLNKGCKPMELCKDGYYLDQESLGYSLTMGRLVNGNSSL